MSIISESKSLRFFVETLAENRLLPHSFLKNRASKRLNFLKSVIGQGGVGAEIGVQKGFLRTQLLGILSPRSFT